MKLAVILNELCVKVLNLVLDDLWVTKASLVDDMHALFDNVWVSRVPHLKDGLLLNTEYPIVGVEVRNHEVEDVGAGAFLQTAC